MNSESVGLDFDYSYHQNEYLDQFNRYRGVSEDERPLRLLMLGDSWFHFPLPAPTTWEAMGLWHSSDVRIFLMSSLNKKPCILPMTQFGDATQDMDERWARDWDFVLKHRNEYGVFDALLVSAGGNNFVGKNKLLGKFINPRSLGSKVDEDVLLRAFNQGFDAELKYLKSWYEKRIQEFLAHNQDGLVVINAYDFPFVTGTGAIALGHDEQGCNKYFAGPWLRPALIDAGWEVKGDKLNSFGRRVLVVLLTKFKAMLGGLSQQFPKNVIVANTQGALKDEFDWHDEMHPQTRSCWRRNCGFERISKHFVTPLRERFGADRA